jgi:hypothetical protein
LHAAATAAVADRLGSAQHPGDLFVKTESQLERGRVFSSDRYTARLIVFGKEGKRASS